MVFGQGTMMVLGQGTRVVELAQGTTVVPVVDAKADLVHEIVAHGKETSVVVAQDSSRAVNLDLDTEK